MDTNKRLEHQVKRKLICFAAGKSGGHVIPCLTIAQQEYRESDFIFFTTNASLDRTILARSNINVRQVPLALNSSWKIPFVRQTFTLFFLTFSFFKSLWYLILYRPERIISTGGIVAVPVCLAGFLLAIPIDLYELNAIPGKAIYYLRFLAQRIFIMFDKTRTFFPAKKCSVVTYPVRFTVEQLSMTKAEARKTLNLLPQGFTLFILGGSQGSLFMNNIIKKWIEEHAQFHHKIQIIHQIGANDHYNWENFYEKLGIPARVFAFQDSLAVCYAACDLVITRAGAGTLFEIIAFKKQMIVVPLETKQTNHQHDNAKEIAAMYPQHVSVYRQKEIADHLQLFFTAINQHINS